MKNIFLILLPVFFALNPNAKTDLSTAEATENPALAAMDSLRLKAKVIAVEDGDTVYALYNGELQLALRLAHIDAPEKRGNQPYWQQSKQKLSDLCFGQTITFTAKRNSKGNYESDLGGRIIAVIYDEKGRNVNYQMVRSGLAWHYKKYSDDKRYDAAEKIAKTSKLGLWNSNSPVSPDDFRKL